MHVPEIQCIQTHTQEFSCCSEHEIYSFHKVVLVGAHNTSALAQPVRCRAGWVLESWIAGVAVDSTAYGQAGMARTALSVS